MTNNQQAITAAFFLGVLTMFFAMSENYDESSLAKEYCDNVELFRTDTKAGIPIEDRLGHSDFKLSYARVCNDQ